MRKKGVRRGAAYRPESRKEEASIISPNGSGRRG